MVTKIVRQQIQECLKNLDEWQEDTLFLKEGITKVEFVRKKA